MHVHIPNSRSRFWLGVSVVLPGDASVDSRLKEAETTFAKKITQIFGEAQLLCYFNFT